MFNFSKLAVSKKHVRTPEETELVRRLDLFLMTFGCISQVIKYLDQTNISNAYVSGMQKDLNLSGNELNYFTTYFSISYCLMLIPSQIILTYMRPSYWLSSLEICWGIMTGVMASVTSANQVYAIRFFLGLFEASAWPGMMTLLIHWYTPTEMAKRMGFYCSCQAFGSMLSGALAVAIMNTLDGRNGIAGWRWLFIINCIMTICVGFAGFVCLPDLPNNPNPRAFWFKKHYGRVAMERLEKHGKIAPKKITLASVKRTARSWVAYFIVILYIAGCLASYGIWYFAVFLKALKNPDGTPIWNTSQVNAIPIGGSAATAASEWIFAILSDVWQTRWPFLVFQGVLGLIGCIYMTVWTKLPVTTPLGGAYASYFLVFMTIGTAPMMMAWLSDLIPQDPESATLIVALCVALYYAITAWSQVLIWPTTQAPYYILGWSSSIGIWILVIVMTMGLVYIDRRILLPQREAARQVALVAEPVYESEPDSPESESRGSDAERGSTKVAGNTVSKAPLEI